MTPRVIEGWDLKVIQEDRLYRHRKTIGQKELHLDIFGMQNSLWGCIEDYQYPLENCIDIIYDQGTQRWESRICGKRMNNVSSIISGPRIGQSFDTAEDLARFLVNLANEITSSSWEKVKSKPVLAFNSNTSEK
jgi:hypothetical protein